MKRRTYLSCSSDDDSSDEEDTIKSIKIVVIGDNKVGKTNLISRIVRNQFSIVYQQTKSIEVHNQIHLGDVSASIWDVPYKIVRYYNISCLNSDAIILMYDVDKPETLDRGIMIWKRMFDVLYKNSIPNLWFVVRGKRPEDYSIPCCPNERLFFVDNMCNTGIKELMYDIRTTIINIKK
jgi:GTPase SAR1 family protein